MKDTRVTERFREESTMIFTGRIVRHTRVKKKCVREEYARTK